MDEAVEVDQEEHDADGDRDAGDRHATSGTEDSLTPRSSASENVSVPTNIPSTAFCNPSRYHRRMKRGERVCVAICTTSTPKATTKPVSPTSALTIAPRIVLAVDSE